MHIPEISADLLQIVFGSLAIAFALNDPVQFYSRADRGRRGWLAIRRGPEPKPIATLSLSRWLRVTLAILGIALLLWAAWDIIHKIRY